MLDIVIIDDDDKAIEVLEWELSKFADRINVCAKFTAALEGLDFIRNNKIDALFLDIQMPTLSGFDLLKLLPEKNVKVIITSSYSTYGIKAVKEDVFDYLLKPIDSEDLIKTIVKLEQSITHQTTKSINNFNNVYKGEKISLETEGKLILIPTNTISYVEADGNYVTFYLNTNKKIVASKRLKDICEMLDTTIFYRIHNSYLVNLTKIKEVIKNQNYIVLENNKKIPISRQRKAVFYDKISSLFS